MNDMRSGLSRELKACNQSFSILVDYFANGSFGADRDQISG
jgi:hypothetical protein